MKAIFFIRNKEGKVELKTKNRVDCYVYPQKAMKKLNAFKLVEINGFDHYKDSTYNENNVTFFNRKNYKRLLKLISRNKFKKRYSRRIDYYARLRTGAVSERWTEEETVCVQDVYVWINYAINNALVKKEDFNAFVWYFHHKNEISIEEMLKKFENKN